MTEYVLQPNKRVALSEQLKRSNEHHQKSFILTFILKHILHIELVIFGQSVSLNLKTSH